MTASREFRVATLFAAPAVAAVAALAVRSARLLSTTAPVLAALWAIMIAALAARAIQDARRRDKPPTDLRPAWHQLDVLTATGSSVAWTAAAALIACGVTGWASLSVLGVLGLGAVFAAATWTAVAAGGDAPWRRATISRAIVPELATDGEPLRDQVQLTGVRIPAGMRLFATSRALPDGATVRHAVGSECSMAEVRLDAELGAAARGEHCAAPLTLWLGDVLGLTRTQPVEHGEVRFSVLSRPLPVDGVRALLGAGGDDAASQPTARQPTDGTFRIRDYTPGDDARRIHWVRSLQTRRLVVRLADEIPHAEPAVRLILDSELWGADDLTCRAPRELLDALVRIWLGVGRALTDAGIRVTLVAAAERGATPAVGRPIAATRGLLAGRSRSNGPRGIELPLTPQATPDALLVGGTPSNGPRGIELPLTPQATRDALRLGGQIAWQTALPLAALLAEGAAARQVVVSSRPRKPSAPPRTAWIVVPECAWTSPEPPMPERQLVKLPFPSGCADNRLTRRARDRRDHAQMRNDRTMFSQVLCLTELATFSGELLARPHRGRVALEAIP